MGRNFLQNLADHGYHVAGYDKDEDKTAALLHEAAGKPVGTAHSACAACADVAAPAGGIDVGSRGCASGLGHPRPLTTLAA